MRIAAMESCFGGMTRDEKFSLAAQAGAQGIELVLDDADALASLAQDDEIARLAALRDQTGIVISGVALMANNRTDGLITDSGATRPAMDAALAAITAAARLAAPVLLLPFAGKSAIEQEHELTFACDRLLELDEQAEKAGVLVGIESMLSTNQKLFLIDHTGGGVAVRLYYDVGNVLLRKLDPATELRDLGADALCGVHLRDLIVREGQPAETNLLLGQGHGDFQAVAQSLRAIRYDGWVTLETPPLDNPLESAAKNVAFAKKLLAR